MGGKNNGSSSNSSSSSSSKNAFSSSSVNSSPNVVNDSCKYGKNKEKRIREYQNREIPRAFRLLSSFSFSFLFSSFSIFFLSLASSLLS